MSHIARSPRQLGNIIQRTRKAAGLGPTLIIKAIIEILERAEDVPDKALSLMTEDFAPEVHDSIVASMSARLRLLETAFEAL